MALLSGNGSGIGAPINVSSGDFTYTTGPYNGNSTVFPIVLNTSLAWTAGRYVVLKSTAISNFAGCTVSFSGPTTLQVRGWRRENVVYSGTTFDCIVVTLA